MGGKGRKSNKMFITAKEWSAEWGGAKPVAEENSLFTRLRFDCCSLSFQPMKDPVAAPDGTCFERSNILEYLDQHGTHPRTGEPLRISDLFALKFHCNTSGDPHCPVTFKVFTEHSHIVAIRTTGNVFSFDAVNEMNVKFKNWKDLLDDTPFTKKDIVTIQDPHNIHKQNYSEFHHVKSDQLFVPSSSVAEDEDSVESKINLGGVHASATKRILEELNAKQAAKTRSSQLREEPPPECFSTPEEAEEPAPSAPEEVAAAADVSVPNAPEPQKAQQSSSSSSSSSVGLSTRMAPVKSSPAAGGALTPQQRAAPPERKVLYSTHPQGQQYAAACITTTALQPIRKDRKLSLTEKEIREKAYQKLRLLRKKSYVRLFTNVGELNIELASSSSPMTCHNFLTLCKNGYYDGTIFHRSIKNFMIQGGDPTGTGTGGESIFDGPFADEFYDKTLTHQGKGIVSMANSGPNSNKSQFFITYKSAKHLDGKHTIFGKVVGGLETLAKMEQIKTDDDDRPLEKIVFLRAEVYVDSVSDVIREVADELTKAPPTPEELEKRRQAELELERRADWFSNPTSGFALPKAVSQGVGKYIDKNAVGVLPGALAGGCSLGAKPSGATEGTDDIASSEPPVKMPKRASQFDFSSW